MASRILVPFTRQFVTKRQFLALLVPRLTDLSLTPHQKASQLLEIAGGDSL